MGAGVVVVGADTGSDRHLQIRVESHDETAVITEIAENLDSGGAPVVDAGGRAVLPGFSDHHLHLFALAVADASVRCGPPAVADAGQLGAALRAARPDGVGWIRGTGYVESVSGDLTAKRIDALESARPVRIQHRSGAMWMLNSRAVAQCGLAAARHPGIERDDAGYPTGRVWRADDWLRERLPDTGFPALTGVGDRLRQLGIVEVTDATPDLDDRAVAAVVDAVDRGEISGRVQLLGAGSEVRIDHPRITVGPVKIVIGDSSLPGLDELAHAVAASHDAGRAVAVHCVSRVALALLLAAFDIAGTRRGDRIEHGGMIPADAVADLARRGLTVVTQPGFLADRGDDFLAGTAPADHDDLYRCGSLIDAGVPVALSSDAPYGPLNPWTTIAAAVDRRTASGRRVGASAERITVAQALARHRTPIGAPAGAARRIAVGQPGDLIVADRPYAAVLDDPGSVSVTIRVIGGRVC
ncbi:amidohydrolase family protein [Gordonia sp. ABSL1-1]|uniref:amidohydrolase family protein n=1 Tax=Gordonia sp. ABSL1-1 TaxID=3053923 RepID=UPI002573E95D|nr:amidohydrolase family protein [Gordonia sp. ABSL1-1]MDL9936575.1 amidohydrolase family protein [Gordonia sp. ABSL1-1]